VAASSVPESHRDLLAARPAVTLATIGPDGFPQVTAMWFLVDGDDTVKASLNMARQKVRNLRRHPEATLFFTDPDNPYRTLEIRAMAEVVSDPDYAFADRVGAKYGVDLRERDRPGELRVVVTFSPVKVNTYG
jgi:PPOX class probable F420-dependent enzyme